MTAIATALPPGALGVVLRERDLPAREQVLLAKSLIAGLRCRRHQLLVSERVDLALAVGADGVHLPAPPRGLPAAVARQLAAGLIIGVSTHSLQEIASSAAAGVAYVTFGPVYDTPSKQALGRPLGEEALARAVMTARERSIGLYALGGIDAERASRCRALGVTGVACIRAALAAREPAAAARALLTSG